MNVVLAGGKDGSNWAFGPSYRATQCICILCAGDNVPINVTIDAVFAAISAAQEKFS